MKQKLMFCLLLAGSFCLTANAQIQKGKWIGSIGLNGRNYKSVSNLQNNFTAEYIDNQFNSSLILSKMINNKFMLGAGLNYNRKFFRNYSVQLPPSASTQTITQTFGFMVQSAFLKKIAKNLYLSQVLQIGYNDWKLRGKENYGYPSEKNSTQTGYEVLANCIPLQFSYLFKNKFILSLNLVNVNYTYIKREPHSDSPGKIYVWDYSFNPLKNGVTLSYILN